MQRPCLIALTVIGALSVGAILPTTAMSLRKATPTERAQILKSNAATSQGVDHGRCRTLGYVVRVSTVNTSYIRLNFNNRVRELNGCRVGDGFRVMRRIKGTPRYRPLGDSSWTGAPCWAAPRKVAIDLVSDYGRTDPYLRRCAR